jgi:hypothetical protein
MSDTTEVNAAQFVMEVQAVGAEENPAVTNSTGRAFGRFVFDEDTRRLTFDVTVSGLSPNLVTAAHIHRGARGVNGPIIHFISATGFVQASGVIQLSEGDVADLRAGNLYLNVHSVEHPGGFARGQLLLPAQPTPAPTTAPTGGGTVRPPSTGDAGLLDSGSSSSLPVGLAAFGLVCLAGFALARKLTA